MKSLRVILLAVLAWAAAGCGSAEPPDEAADAPTATATATPEQTHGIAVSYTEPRSSADAVAKEILELGGLTDIAEGFGENFALPVDVQVKVRPGSGSPFYDPSTRTVNVFYGFATTTANIIKAGQPGITQAEFGKQWAAVNDFIFIHELGHMFVDVFDIPITGREEDAVDAMATTFMTDQVVGGPEYAFDAARFFDLLQGVQGEPDAAQFQDEHSLSVQRAYDIVCAIAGSSQATMREVASLQILQPARLARCPAEYEQKSEAWTTLLKPHLRSSSDLDEPAS